MAVPNDGTNQYPFDNASKKGYGVFDDVTGLYYAPRANEGVVLLANATRTVVTTSPIQQNYNFRGVIVTFCCNSLGASTTFTVNLYFHNYITGLGDMLIGQIAGINDGSPSTICCYPGAVATGFSHSVSFSQPLARQWYIQVNPSNANASAYQVEAQLIR